ncbi:flagellar hook capping FlgD N-terminal domain-containing protein [Paucibacter sediminis]|uniref:Basal-body rod modification protein FlgD n=1 Tax=Paucibacter sediminis TaxID=3019553 RepID=A0AA95NEI1_9BURK|nr:flagellar hook capping FlgD N-terminal domain-containing protein [Paucibacter sp. S2-9]WIT11387.1 flagellar hook capping FlgD N-terminal domain-containing protein [Paucibacter sp. S2-9]
MSSAVSNNTNVAAGSAAGGEVAGNGAMSNLFTTLLVAQIKNQDPLSPADPSAFVNQLTQLSQMEALQKLASQGSSNSASLQSLQMLGLGAQVGSLVQAKVEQLHLAQGAVQTSFSLQSPAAEASLLLTGSDGQTQRIALGSRPAGESSYLLDPVKLGLSPGDYRLRIETDSKEVAPLELVTELSRVKLGAGGNVLLALGTLAEVGPEAITQFRGRAATPSH